MLVMKRKRPSGICDEEGHSKGKAGIEVLLARMWLKRYMQLVGEGKEGGKMLAIASCVFVWCLAFYVLVSHGQPFTPLMHLFISLQAMPSHTLLECRCSQAKSFVIGFTY